jgi:hypothetical protein
MLADVDVATRVNVHMPWFGRTGSQLTQGAPGGARIVLLRCGSVNPVTVDLGSKVATREGVLELGQIGIRATQSLHCIRHGAEDLSLWLPLPSGEGVGVLPPLWWCGVGARGNALCFVIPA